MNSKINTLDVREDFRSGKWVFEKIQSALGCVEQGEVLRLLVPFEPVPLFRVAASKGLDYESKQMASGDWEVLFSRDAGAVARKGDSNLSSTDACGCGPQDSAEVVEVDARGLEPPQPMVRILEALAGLSRAANLRARTDRRPVHLYAHLEERGFVGESEEQKDGSFITHIRHA